MSKKSVNYNETETFVKMISIVCSVRWLKQQISDSPEIRILANLAGRDVGSVTGANLLNIGTEFDLDPWTCSPGQLKEKYNFYQVPAEDEWRLPLLVKLLNQRMEMRACDEATTTISELIDSLCYS